MTYDTHDCMWLGLGSSWLTHDKPRSRNVIINQIDNNNIIFYVIKMNATYSSETNIIFAKGWLNYLKVILELR